MKIFNREAEKVTSLFHLISLFENQIQTLDFVIESNGNHFSKIQTIKYEQNVFEIKQGLIHERDFMEHTIFGPCIFEDMLWYLKPIEDEKRKVD